MIMSDNRSSLPAHATSGIEGRSDSKPVGEDASPGSRSQRATARCESRGFPAGRITIEVLFWCIIKPCPNTLEE